MLQACSIAELYDRSGCLGVKIPVFQPISQEQSWFPQIDESFVNNVWPGLSVNRAREWFAILHIIPEAVGIRFSLLRDYYFPPLRVFTYLAMSIIPNRYLESKQTVEAAVELANRNDFTARLTIFAGFFNRSTNRLALPGIRKLTLGGDRWATRLLLDVASGRVIHFFPGFDISGEATRILDEIPHDLLIPVLTSRDFYGMDCWLPDFLFRRCDKVPLEELKCISGSTKLQRTLGQGLLRRIDNASTVDLVCQRLGEGTSDALASAYLLLIAAQKHLLDIEVVITVFQRALEWCSPEASEFICKWLVQADACVADAAIKKRIASRPDEWMTLQRLLP